MMSSHMMDSSPFGGWAADHAVSIAELDGETLPVADVVRIARGAARPVPGGEAMKRVDRSWAAARELAATGRVYGRSTGVGANRNEEVPTEAAADHGLRLLRSHAGAIGEPLPVGRAFEPADSLLEGEFADRPLTDDVKAAAGELLDRCTNLWNTDLTSTSTRGTA